MQKQETRTGAIPAKIEKLVYGGDGLARVDGQVLLVPFTLPGEQIETVATSSKGKVLRGRAPQVITASPERVIPGCEYYGTCGGCHYQHAGYEYQVAQKLAILRETLQRLGGVTPPDEIEAITGPPWQYRNRIQLHVAKGRVGFRKAGSHEICSITHCPISSPKLNEAIKILREATQRREWPEFVSGIELFTNEEQIQLNVNETGKPVAARFFEWVAGLFPGFASRSLPYTAAGRVLEVGRGTFFQVNRFLVDALVKEVVGEYRGGTALDLYAGAGLFSLPFAERFERVTAVERGTSAIRDLETNGKPFANLEIERSATEDYLRAVEETPDLIVADPPRGGLGADATAELLRIKAPQVVIVSCDPATLARDLKVLTPQYEIRRLTLVDLFPQTYHFETVVHLARNM